MGFRIVPDEKRYYNMKKQGVFNIKFEKQKERKFCFSQNPFPGDGRFEPPKAHEKQFDLPPVNIEMISKYRNTSVAPRLKSYSQRKELWPVQDLPDS